MTYIENISLLRIITFVKEEIDDDRDTNKDYYENWSIDTYTIKKPCHILVCDNYDSNKAIIFLPLKRTLMSYVYFSTSFDRWTSIHIEKEKKKNNIHAYHPHS
jgi:hypothetical protein